MPKVVISYRRADSDAIAGRIRDRLAHHFGEDSIFMDVDSIPFGTDFRDYVRDALFDSDVLVAIVGPKWLGPAEGTHLRIREENDPIRIEVETALNRGISVIPVLVNGGVMPKPSELPVALENFAFRNAAEVDSGRDFHPHMDRLIRSIEQILRAKGRQAPDSAASTPAAIAGLAPVRPEAPSAASPPSIAEAVESRPAAAAPMNVESAAVAAANTTAPKPKRRGMAVALAVLGAIAALGIAGIAYWYLAQLTPSDPKSTPVIAQPEPPRLPTPPAVVAGCPGKPAFQDGFKTPDPGWELGSDNRAYYVDGQLAIKAEPETYTAVIYRSLVYKNATICLDVKTPLAMNSPDYGGGLIFWAVDYANFYRVTVSYDGRYQISRRANGNWITITPLSKFDGLKQGYGVVNRIKVTTVGNVATVYLNDRKAQDIKGQPPRTGGSVGMSGTSEKDQANEWRFVSIAVIELPPSETVRLPPSEAATKTLLADCKLNPPSAFADDFKVPDQGWANVEDDRAYFANGRFILKPMPNKIWRALYPSLLFKDVTICADVISPPQMTAENDTAGGVVFWATEGINSYHARVYPDGSYSIGRTLDGNLVGVAGKMAAAVVNKGPNALNRMKVVLTGAIGALYINDVKTREFRGQPPPNPSSFGLYAEAETKNRVEWGFSGIVLTEP